MKLKNIFFILFISVLTYSQTIKITVLGAEDIKGLIYSLSGEKTTLLDSVSSDKNGEFIYNVKNKMQTGFYRLTLKNYKWIDFIFDMKNVDLSTNIQNIADSMKVIFSVENTLYYTFVKLNKTFKQKTELLQLILARYPKDDDYYKQTQKRLNELQNDYISFVNFESQKNPKNFVSRYIRSAQLPLIDGLLSPEKYIEYLKSHSLDYVDFNDAELIKSDAFTNKAIEYLTYFRNPQLPKELLEKEFMTAIDTLLQKTETNQFVYQHVTEYLIDGFKKFGFDKVLDYIVENYVIKDGLCLDVKTEGLIKRRIDQASKLKIGNNAPDINSYDTKGNEVQLKKINSGKILAVFYASWCPHCSELLPELNRLTKENQLKDIKVLAISLDSNKEDWLNFVKNYCTNLINVSDLKGWDGKASNDYFIYATPSMFLIDKEMKIVNKLSSFDELMSILKK